MPLFGPPNIEKMKEKKDVKGLIKALKHKDANIRKGAAKALGEIDDAQAVELLIAALKDSNGNVRGIVAVVLGKIGDARAVGPLIGAFRDDHWKVPLDAAEALSKIGASTVEPLIAALQDSNESVRGCAVSRYGSSAA